MCQDRLLGEMACLLLLAGVGKNVEEQHMLGCATLEHCVYPQLLLHKWTGEK